ncbi:small nuclear ribonucleoprotein-associated protein B'-like [Falco rusticolus]|uniref:small nuclear ribonucleoprotein-associated protein B'-like n=1 Tax=Falco rusticolus TaxID=120794 RepID=UPI00188681EE|nr:small nuclear ribonucleoprotein-associated protein B'-like [Falco rusticolus]XP_055576585.1 small nuclear ribonucleoprotein-associated protein B'-like [Falco cherrug]
MSEQRRRRVLPGARLARGLRDRGTATPAARRTAVAGRDPGARRARRGRSHARACARTALTLARALLRVPLRPQVRPVQARGRLGRWARTCAGAAVGAQTPRADLRGAHGAERTRPVCPRPRGPGGVCVPPPPPRPPAARARARSRRAAPGRMLPPAGRAAAPPRRGPAPLGTTGAFRFRQRG